MLEPLTKRQKQILQFITEFSDDNDYAPTLEEIRVHFELKSISTVHEHVENLKTKGYLKKSMNQARGIVHISSNPVQEDFINLPIIGKLVHNKPVKQLKETKTLIVHKDSFAGLNDVYGLQIDDDSFMGANIIKDDVLIVSKEREPQNGDLVICTVGNRKSVYLKKYFKETFRIKLQSLRDSIKPRFCKSINLMGIVTGVHRRII